MPSSSLSTCRAGRQRRARRPADRSGRAPGRADRTSSRAADWPRPGSPVRRSGGAARRGPVHNGSGSQRSAAGARRVARPPRRGSGPVRRHPRTRCPARAPRRWSEFVRGRRIVLGAIDPLIAQPLELACVDGRPGRSEVDEISRRSAEQNLCGSAGAIGLDDAPQVGHVRLDRCGRLLGWITGPQLLDQLAGADRRPPAATSTASSARCLGPPSGSGSSARRAGPGTGPAPRNACVDPMAGSPRTSAEPSKRPAGGSTHQPPPERGRS